MKIPRLPVDLSGIFRFSRKEILIIVSAVSAVLLIAIVITVITASVRRGPRQKAEDSMQVFNMPEGYVPAEERPFLSEFIIYEDKLQESFTGVKYYNEPKDHWSDEDIARFWVAPKEIAAEHLEIDAEKAIMDIFADVP